MEKKRFLDYLYLFFIIVILYLLTYKLGLMNDMKTVQMIMMSCILIAIFFLYNSKSNNIMTHSGKSGNENEYEKKIALLIMIGCIMRIGYMIYTPCNIRGHDIGDITFGATGHAGYILTLLEGHQLPDSNMIQLYHPPLFHILSAFIISVTQLFLKETDPIRIVDAAKIISCFASCGSLYVIRSLCKELKLTKDATLITLSIIAAFPNFYLLAGRVNNDSLVIFFMLLAILYTYRWYHNQSYANLVGMALSIGLGMMTKISCGIIALFTGTVMIIVLIKQVKEKQLKQIILQFATFAGICFPLALWYPIRNYLLFQQPFSYVNQIPIDSDIFCGNYSFFERFFSLPLKQLFSPLYARPFDDYNVLIYTMKSSIFGEFYFNIPDFIPILLLIFNVILIAFSVFSMIYIIFFEKETSKEIRYGLGGIWVIIFSSFLYFNIKYPFGCTMDYRYIVPTVVVSAIFLGITYSQMNLKKVWIRDLYQKGLSASIVGFFILSILMYCNIA